VSILSTAKELTLPSVTDRTNRYHSKEKKTDEMISYQRVYILRY